MRPYRFAAVVVTLTLGAGVLLAAPAAAGPLHELQSLALSPTAVSVSGFSSVPVTITATIRADDGVGGCGDEPFAFGGGIAAMVQHPAPAALGVLTDDKVELKLIAGTNVQGTWQGTWHVPATDGGTWVVDRVLGCTGPAMMGGGQAYFDVRPADVGINPTLKVNAAKVPTMTMTRTPAVAAYGASQLIRWTFRNANGTKLAGRRIKVGTDVGCGFYWWGDRIATLDANGSFAIYRSLANLSGKGDRCVILTTKADAGGTVMLSDRSLNRWYFKTVTAKVSASTVKLGSAATVTGVVAPRFSPSPNGPKAGLQRYQNGSWKGVSIVAVKAAGTKPYGTYSLSVKPPSKGTWWFRIIAVPGPYDGDLVVTPTKAFSVKAV